jgi:1-aminocyclopropane-1-carboxylate deaminase/D-cysteine desulfhydrase-like pyridoxal-dependent ACC family enzyme
MSHWPLFDAYPHLEEQLSPLQICELPTPVEALPGLGARAWIKRDDLTHSVYGGNKMRKLELVGAAILRRRARRVFTFGATGTNSGVATALFCQQHGIQCTLFTFPQPPSAVVSANQKLLQRYAVRQIPCASLLAAAVAWHIHPRRLDPRSHFVFAGCSDPVSVFGYVNAAFELRQQVRRGECPEPAEIVVAAGSAATLAGLTLGCAAAGLASRVIGVRVAPSRAGPFAACTPGTVRALMRRANRLLHEQPLPAVDLRDDWYGQGYGYASSATAAAMEQAAQLGLNLEATYTGKAFAAFLERLACAAGPVLFWNTFNSRRAP